MRSKFDLGALLEKGIAGRWIAGARIRDAVARAGSLNALGESAVINYLGEGFRERWEVADAVSHYQRLIKAIARAGVDASISLKITQLGLNISAGLARRSYGEISGRARKQGIFTWLDMESHGTVDATLSAYERQLGKGGVGISLQACLRRTEQDMKRLVGAGAVVRLVKGAYPEYASAAFATKGETRSNYMRLVGYLFRNAEEFTVATRDRKIIDEALLLSRSYRKRVTYEMLSGVGNACAERLVERGNRVAVYVPFGRRWKGYAYRRIKEGLHALPILRNA